MTSTSTRTRAYCHGKGRKDRATPLTPHTAEVLTTWLAEQHPDPAGPLFATRARAPLSREAVQHLVTRHTTTTTTAAEACPSLQATNVTPHTLRHYVDGRVMWPAGVSRLVAELRVLGPAT